MTQQSETILDRIVADKRDELTAALERVPLAEMRRQAEAAPAPRGFAKALRGPKISLIAEAKKASPSRGVLRADFDPVWLAGRYTEGGAAAISVLTDEKHFQGSLGYMRAVREALPQGPPILRKDFTIDPYHLYEARANGADAVLLIASILADSLLRDLMATAEALGLDALIEVHEERELARAPVTDAPLIGITNRDLRTFNVDLATTERLRPLAPPNATIVSESGIFTREDMVRLERAGVDAVLIGEGVVTAPDPADKIRELLG
ncbi:MAG: indole-3-glycerol phosphate synthase TrpC [Chloroflexi bacterium]|nr:indole-3-glycerol phosphate synthase TrpC [Chloroflexota bacterium]MCI0814126.1 indole-3-glycerol phosphate synthase TrpC [Chloroflexota bacterium]MCI0818210.1 indole-3-glycerol phosphate synthase TrpC [Chloroflexota bacterium]MCI0831384.1 indole-3-glycerol phosphate synthase TrpC [Chloroflexota bacterium]MCI0839003.1 indole-3-glycerol phosphate synthase TrpC [Chloroflexota bacterium]